MKRCLALPFLLCACATTQTSVERSDDESREVETTLEAPWKEVFTSGDAETYQRVTAAFAAHLEARPEDREAKNRYGKLLYAQGQWRAAADTFEEVARGTDHFASAAARNAILAWRRVLDHGDASDAFNPLAKDEDVDRAALTFLWDEVVFEDLPKGRYAERELSDVEQHLADAADRYVAVAELTEEALPTIQLISANSYYRHYHFAATADRCLRIVERWPRLELANTCGNIILHVFSVGDQLEPLEHYARTLRENRAAMSLHTELSDSVEETLHYAGFQNAWALVESANQSVGEEKKRLLLEAAARFQRYQSEFPSSPHADKALFNALAQYVNLGVKDTARTVATLIVEDYPQSPVARDARKVLASLER